MKLYEIDSQITDLIDQAIDPETGEINEEVYTELEKLQMERDRKIENIVLWIKDLNAEALAIKTEKNALAQRQAQAEKKAESLKKYLAYALKGEKFKTARCTVSYRKSEAVEIVDEEQAVTFLTGLPKWWNYVKTEAHVKKDAVKDLIKKIGPVDGLEIVERISVILK